MIRLAVLPQELLRTIPHQLHAGAPPPEKRPAHVLRLPHPRTGVSTLFLLFDTHILELQRVNPPDPRSWFLEQEVAEDGRLLLMTPIDPTFLMLGILQCLQLSDGTLGRFRPAEDLLEEAAMRYYDTKTSDSDNPTFKEDILYFVSSHTARRVLKYICETKEISGDLVVYRFSLELSIQYLRKKVNRLASSEIHENSNTLLRALAKDGLMEEGKECLLEVARIKCACSLVAQYLSGSISDSLTSSFDFTELDIYAKKNELATMNQADIPANGKHKNKVAQTTDSKKRKSAKASNGVEQLKKANTSGMAKLSTFFKKT